MLKPDIVSLEEVEDCAILQRLADALAARGQKGYVPYMVKGTDTSTGQNVGLLTKVDPVADLSRTEARAAFPVEGNQCGYSGSGGTYGVSKHYRTKFVIEGVTISACNRPKTRPSVRRTVV